MKWMDRPGGWLLSGWMDVGQDGLEMHNMMVWMAERKKPVRNEDDSCLPVVCSLQMKGAGEAIHTSRHRT